jgi:hypothetical protein
MSHPTTEAPSRFPHWVALGSLALVLWLFFGHTVPALREQQILRDHATTLAQLRADYDGAITQARLGIGPNAHFDLQALLVAIDQRGYTPFELCAAYPERSAHHPEAPDDPPSRPDVSR